MSKPFEAEIENIRMAEKSAIERSKKSEKEPPMSQTMQELLERCEAVKKNPPGDEMKREFILPDQGPMPVQLLGLSGIPARYQSASVALGDSVLPLYADKFAKLIHFCNRPSIVGLIGRRGAGKTWMSCAMVRDFCQHGKAAIYCKVGTFFARVKASYGSEAQEKQPTIEAGFVRPALLVLDEMHERGGTDWEDRLLTRLIDLRYDAMKTTLLVSNQSPDEFVARVGESIADRIRDGGGIIVCAWSSLRK